MSLGFVFDQKASQQCQESTYSIARFLLAVKKLLGANLARVYIMGRGQTCSSVPDAEETTYLRCP